MSVNLRKSRSNMIESIGKARLSDIVADRLKQYIVDEGLSPGDRLPTEGQLAASFGISRLSLREATKSLGFLGIVEARPGRGLTVGSVRMDRVTRVIGFHPDLLKADPLSLIGTRVVIETGVLPHVVRRMREDPSIRERLLATNAELESADNLTRFVELDIRFHRLLIESSGLTPLIAFTDVLTVFFRRFRESVKKAEWSTGIQAHNQIVEALHEGRIDAASELLRTHIESHARRIPSNKAEKREK